ncbi:uncharacterized protein CLUP02_15258 [Colletotrichum lupini]|uniref:Uncharacterized protein n=1 Tax=Colletotrichum lupini TaxID=145971 RepID=A0A9Q8T5W5_9PEZI|nr:uncharacterized protein CLUP02_15258 [Colletotrichum lupini]UQC89727.1 hypothetical protein CLUP02_15258 [Colletotrichum lupini]
MSYANSTLWPGGSTQVSSSPIPISRGSRPRNIPDCRDSRPPQSGLCKDDMRRPIYYRVQLMGQIRNSEILLSTLSTWHTFHYIRTDLSNTRTDTRFIRLRWAASWAMAQLGCIRTTSQQLIALASHQLSNFN